MEVTDAMVHAAIKQAVKDKIIPSHAHEDLYLHHWASVERMIKAAIEMEGEHLSSLQLPRN
jgi:hypothetical protein